MALRLSGWSLTTSAFVEGWIDIDPSALSRFLIAAAALSAALVLKVNDRTDRAFAAGAGSAGGGPAGKSKGVRRNEMRFKFISPPEVCRRRSSPHWPRLSELRRSSRFAIDTSR